MEASIGSRITQLRDALNISQEELGNKIGVSRFSVSNYESGKRNVTDRTIKDICREFNVSYIWLTQGIGDMFSSPSDDLASLIENILEGENEAVVMLFKAFAKLDEKDWEDLRRIIEKIKK